MENENREEIESLSDSFISSVLFDSNSRELFVLLKYLDPYGDTVFNHLQMNDLISDLIVLKKYDPINSSIDRIISLAKVCQETIHSYLVFYGD